MQKSTLPQGIKALKNWKEKGTLTFDNAIQRAGSQWSLLQKSLLIHSMLASYPIPACYFLKSKNNDGETAYDCLDAKQRLTSIFDFIDGEYALSSATPSVTYDGFEYDLADMRFEELPDELQDEILGYRLSIFCLEDCTDDEVEEIFARLNNSTPLSPIQKCRSVMGSELAKWCKEICASDFYQHSVNLTLAQVRREADLETLLQAMMLLDSRHEGYDDWKAISTAEVTKYCKHIRGSYDEDKRLVIEEIIDYLFRAFPHQNKFLKKSNIPTVIVLAKIALENDIDTEEFCKFINYFSNAICIPYEENTGSGNVKRVKTEGRLKAIADVFASEFDLENIDILAVEVDADSLSGDGSGDVSTGADNLAVEDQSGDSDDDEPVGAVEAIVSGDENLELVGDGISAVEAIVSDDENPAEFTETAEVESGGSDDE